MAHHHGVPPVETPRPHSLGEDPQGSKRNQLSKLYRRNSVDDGCEAPVEISVGDDVDHQEAVVRGVVAPLFDEDSLRIAAGPNSQHFQIHLSHAPPSVSGTRQLSLTTAGEFLTAFCSVILAVDWPQPMLDGRIRLGFVIPTKPGCEQFSRVAASSCRAAK
jgi:hypothetical protein